MDVNVVVLHTTEGTSLPSYGGGTSAPNLTAVPNFTDKRLDWYQHFDIDVSSRALVNLAGGVETNTLNVCQVELVGTCDPASHKKWGSTQHIFWPDAPEWALADLADFLRWMHVQHGMPLSGPAKWPAYPSSYANGGGQRMATATWKSFEGVCGHMHVPENTHGDPGAIDFATLITLAKGTDQEEDVALTAADAKTLWTTDGFAKNPNPATAEVNPFIAPITGLTNIEIVVRRTEVRLNALQTANDKLVEAVATLAAGLGDIDPAAIVAELRAAIENVEIRLDIPES